MKTLVIGAGVSGLTTALVLARAGHDVNIWAKDLPENTTSSKAAAFWYPYLCNPREKAIPWSKATREYLVNVVAKDQASGVWPMRMVEYLDEPRPEPWWLPAVEEYGEVEKDNLPDGYTNGYWASMVLIDTSKYLPWLVEQLLSEGVAIEKKPLQSFKEVPTIYDLTINCTGLGARELCNDESVYPVRGQVVRIKQMGLHDVVADDEAHNHLAYIIPRGSDIILGGTAQENDWRTEVDPKDTEDILRRTALLYPELKNVEILEVKVGLRPARDEVRLELENIDGKKVIHNYGHGGAGFTLSWGCAQEVLALTQNLEQR